MIFRLPEPNGLDPSTISPAGSPIGAPPDFGYISDTICDFLSDVSAFRQGKMANGLFDQRWIKWPISGHSGEYAAPDLH